MTQNERIYIILLLLAISFGVFIYFLEKWKRKRPAQMDELDGHDFEYYCAELLRICGYKSVEVTKGSGDFGADILCEKDGVSYAIQCKCYETSVGVHAVQEIYAGKDYYDKMVGVVMSNQYFTKPAVQMAKKLNIMLFDRDCMKKMISSASMKKAG
ncbi:restriction endonuclease [Butyrivibrio sp. NC3005]|uniref:restriction endonuclease n=1 Tax=Butyrivibrio sp. NC3005 TaxID=1280685 RepID=UPI000402805B|nr:restriction endonuclease [Butyrivibrio sp. NC3005]